jgi:Fic family protein
LRETQNLAKLTDIIWSFFDKDFKLDKDFLLDLHGKLLSWIEYNDLWKYRNVQVYISGSNDKLPKSSEVENLMNDFINYCNSNEINILKQIAKIHFDFVKIHPFTDWNWRIARLIMNLYLVKNWFLPIIFPVVTRLEYIQSLWKDKKQEDFYKYFLWQMHENLWDYLRFFED